jgi:pilus assembly protein Flp/PilA
MSIKSSIKRFVADESGASVAEYALLVGVVVVGLVGALQLFKGKVDTALGTAGTGIATPTP